MAAISLDAIMEAVEADDCIGFCISCGDEQHGCEPDARGYTGEACGEPTVFGAEECLLMGIGK